MFKNAKYLTHGVQSEIPIELQIFMWSCIESVPKPDYWQILGLEPMKTMQKIIHEQEQPEYLKEYLLKSDNPITAKIYVIDSDTYSTMLLAEEY